ncbi:MAG: hypothetical protein ACKO8C_03375 [Candidatus Nanopelagicaceae bacterium]
MAGVFSLGRAKIDVKTLRTDRWWLQPTITVAVLGLFVIYATFRAFEGKHYFYEPLISPFYSPCLSTSCVEGASLFGQPFGTIVLFGMAVSPALFILIFPLGFRMTCYYYRKAYYRSFWQSPPACAVAEPHKSYSGETKAPLIVQNSHRYFFFIGMIFNLILTYDSILAFRNHEKEWGHMSVGTLVLVMNAVLLWGYSLSCHSCRHTVGGRLRNFSKHPLRYKMWTWVSKLNEKHQNFAWVSLFGVAFADFYVRLVASGTITDFYFF